MFVDARLLPVDQVIETEVCIVGAGPAGITLAREFIGQKTKVCVVESGGEEVDPQTQALSEGLTVGDPFLTVADTRCRRFGGNSNIWAVKIGNGQIGVRYAPLDEIDFEHRDWIPHSGWPFGRSHLDPFYERAQSVCQAGPFAYEADTWEEEQIQRLPLNEEQVVTKMFQFGARDVFSHKYREELRAADNISVYLNANVINIESNDSVNRVTRLQVATLRDNKFYVAAKVFILATGGLENARILLMSNTQQTAGLGNGHDVVGRYFIDHPIADGGVFVPSDRQLFNTTALYDLRLVRNTNILGHLVPSKAVMEREQLANICAVFFPRPSRRQWKAVESFKAIAESIASKKFPENFWPGLLNTISGIDYVTLATYLAITKRQSLLHAFGRGGWSDIPNNDRRFQSYQIVHLLEQLPQPANRVVLSKERDALGCQKLELQWRWDPENGRSIGRAQEVFARELARAGLGEFQLDRKDGLPRLSIPSGAAHHMGTTRIHVDPKQGVVDENCRVHGVSNLFIAGSSVFPTGGYANPTLTIVALSLRLAEQIKKELATQNYLAPAL
ncbi:GMC oxidoreductase [Fortiea contorta]|uniref:GMC oxidoreductase n=1 Tax=Fortiea contorta TaxID=1892405 RepID=UPI00034A97C2|nr:GMC family oxidoreductase [Fortiea contorta]